MNGWMDGCYSLFHEPFLLNLDGKKTVIYIHTKVYERPAYSTTPRYPSSFITPFSPFSLSTLPPLTCLPHTSTPQDLNKTVSSTLYMFAFCRSKKCDTTRSLSMHIYPFNVISQTSRFLATCYDFPPLDHATNTPISYGPGKPLIICLNETGTRLLFSSSPLA